jgi:acyl carrier protein
MAGLVPAIRVFAVRKRKLHLFGVTWKGIFRMGDTSTSNSVTQIRSMIAVMLHVDEDRIDVDQELFSLGMHSLLLVKLFRDIERTFGTKFSLIEIFNIGPPTVRNIAKLVG